LDRGSLFHNLAPSLEAVSKMLFWFFPFEQLYVVLREIKIVKL